MTLSIVSTSASRASSSGMFAAAHSCRSRNAGTSSAARRHSECTTQGQDVDAPPPSSSTITIPRAAAPISTTDPQPAHPAPDPAASIRRTAPRWRTQPARQAQRLHPSPRAGPATSRRRAMRPTVSLTTRTRNPGRLVRRRRLPSRGRGCGRRRGRLRGRRTGRGSSGRRGLDRRTGHPLPCLLETGRRLPDQPLQRRSDHQLAFHRGEPQQIADRHPGSVGHRLNTDCRLLRHRQRCPLVFRHHRNPFKPPIPPIACPHGTAGPSSRRQQQRPDRPMRRRGPVPPDRQTTILGEYV